MRTGLSPSSIKSFFGMSNGELSAVTRMLGVPEGGEMVMHDILLISILGFDKNLFDRDVSGIEYLLNTIHAFESELEEIANSHVNWKTGDECRFLNVADQRYVTVSGSKLTYDVIDDKWTDVGGPPSIGHCAMNLDGMLYRVMGEMTQVVDGGMDKDPLHDQG